MAGSSVQESPFGTLDMRSTATPPHSPALSQPSPALSHAMAHRQAVAQGSNLRPEGGGTPKMAPRDRMGSVEDTDAAGMLLLMATSPSPARPTSTRDRDARDAAAFHALRGGGSGLKGRVLFPSYGSGDGGSGGHSRTLSREMSGSFASISSSMTEPLSPRSLPPGRRAMDRPPASSITTGLGDPGGGGGLDIPMTTTITPPTPTEQDPSQLVPTAPASPRAQGQSSHSSGAMNSKPVFPPHTPNASFSLSDYVNVSPSPAAVMHSQPRPSSMQPPSGRRLFEGHATPKGSPSRRSAHPTIPPPSSPSPAQKSGLSAGVDLA
ncbi:hypothetical protein NUW54_g3243 [Trametes sanguinea]|uniref:Uncharacterized protein n=1 Tax=Trametes sanguinea TaxID=158606 RepID=A0ACC1Q1J5_9APHY|nr:hypothetical protein NUW54_g3243 [Trametes sanguinea]